MSIIRKLVIGPTTVVFTIAMLVALILASHAAWSLFILKETIYSVSDLLWLFALIVSAVILFVVVQAFNRPVDSAMSDRGKR